MVASSPFNNKKVYSAGPRKTIARRGGNRGSVAPAHPKGELGGVVLATHDASCILMPTANPEGLLTDAWSSAATCTTRQAAVDALHRGFGLTPADLGGDDALIGSSYMEAPRRNNGEDRRSRELFVAQLPEGVAVPSGLHSLDVTGKKAIWDHKDRMMPHLRYAKGGRGSRQGFHGLQIAITKAQGKHAEAHGIATPSEQRATADLPRADDDDSSSDDSSGGVIDWSAMEV